MANNDQILDFKVCMELFHHDAASGGNILWGCVNNGVVWEDQIRGYNQT
jgi:hypothetical protein